MCATNLHKAELLCFRPIAIAILYAHSVQIFVENILCCNMFLFVMCYVRHNAQSAGYSLCTAGT